MLMPINDISNNNKSCSPVVGFFCDYDYMYTLSKTINTMNDKQFWGGVFIKKNHKRFKKNKSKQGNKLKFLHLKFQPCS